VRSIPGFLACLILVTTTAAGEIVRLDQLDLSRSASGHNSFGRNRSIAGKGLTIGGRRFATGVGVHPPSRIGIETHGTTERFHSLVGVDDGVGEESGTVEFRVYGDGEILWKSGLLRGRDTAKAIDLEIDGVRRLELVVTSAGRYSSSHLDHADWADAWLEYEGTVPRTENYPARYPQIDEVAARIDAVQRQLDAYAADPERRDYWRKARGNVVDVESLITEKDRDPLDVFLRRTARLLEHLESASAVEALADLRRRFEEMRTLAQSTSVTDHVKRKTLCRRVLSIRRRITWTNPLLDFDQILFIQRYPLPGHYAAGHNICDQYFGFHAVEGGGLFVLENAFTDDKEPRLRNVLEDSACENGRFADKPLPRGAYLSPDLSFDGRTVLFAWTEAEPLRYRWTEKTTYAVFRVDVDASGLRQLTTGPVNDFDPCWLPNGRITFVSERRGGYGRCHGRPVPTYTLHTMLDDGQDIVCISPHETNEWHPSVDHSGRILYTRWDYVDRGDIQAHHPWVITADGRDPRAVHGNYRRSPESSPCAEMDIRAIPSSAKYLATAAPHHGQAYGTLIQVDPSVVDDDELSQVKRFTPEVEFPQSENGGPVYATAWPLDEFFCLCVYDDRANAVDAVKANYGIYLVDAFGNKELVYRDQRVPCLSPIPLRPRKRPTITPHYTSHGRPNLEGVFMPRAADRPTAPVMVMNVYDSLLPMPADARIEGLRVLQLLPKTTPSANQPRIGYGSQKNARRVLGTVPVEADGSAYFQAPVDVPIYFQALDGHGRAVQSMRSDTHVYAGRGLTCQGCHEPRHQSPHSVHDEYPLALQRRASTIEPDVLGSNPLNYPLLVQPVLDHHCVSCHGGDDDAKPDLRRGDPQRHRSRWFTSYENLEPFAFFYTDQVFTRPRSTPGKFGAQASELLPLLEEGHEGVELSAEELYRITLWLDCNSDFFGAYENIDAQSEGKIVYPTLE
jgi:hypothetical protein